MTARKKLTKPRARSFVGFGSVRLGLFLALLSCGVLLSCGEDEVAPPAKPPSAKPPSASKPSVVTEQPPRPPAPEALVPLTPQDFSAALRDPFQTYMSQRLFDHARQSLAEPRHVVLAAYDLEDLRVIAVVHTGKHSARALLVANDGRSQSAMPGDFLSRSEVRVTAISSRGLEIEVVDEVLAAGLGMTRGERRWLSLAPRGRL